MIQTVENKAETAPKYEHARVSLRDVLDWLRESEYEELKRTNEYPVIQTVENKAETAPKYEHARVWLRNVRTNEYLIYRLQGTTKESCDMISDLLPYGTLCGNVLTQSVSAITDAGATTSAVQGVAEELGAEQVEVERLIDAIFIAARQEDFEDGMDSEFSKRLVSAIRRHGNRAMQEISYLILHKATNDAVSSEALRWIGRMKDPETYGWRLWLLEKSLSYASTVVRDGAMLGIASMGDRYAIPYLKRAIQSELCTELRKDMEEIVRELEAAPHAIPAEEDSKS